jgi:zinc transport system substrate-binding protein
MKRIITVLFVLVLFSCAKKNSKETVISSEKLKVVTVNYPLYYFADRIGGDLIDLEYVIPDNVDPAFWNPDEVALQHYQAADIILLNGANYAKWVENVSMPSSRIVNTSSSFEESLIPLKGGESHSHGPEGEHEHKDYAFTTWLDFKLALSQATSIKNILLKKMPNEKQLLDENFEKLKKDLESLDTKMLKEASKLNEIKLIGSHPVYQYLSKAYNLKINSVHFEPNEIPTKKQWQELEKLTDRSKKQLMLWEDTPLPELQNKLSDLNIEVIVFKPCGNKPAEGDFLSIMKNNINNLKK